MFHLDIIWVYKAILPLFLVGVPIVLYYAFKKQIGDKRAFFATLFFIMMPIYSLEIAQIAKSMVAELFFALAILTMVSTWRWQYKGMAIITCMVLAIVSHYTIGMAMLAYLLGILIVRLAVSRIKWKLFVVRRVSIVMLVLALVIGSSAFYTYYHYAYDGTVNKVIGMVFSWHGGEFLKYRGKAIESTSASMPTDIAVSTFNTPNESYLYNQENLVKVGIGLDFFEQPIEGKLFRIVQYLTQFLIIIGAVYLLFRYSRYKFTAEFLAGVGCSFMLLLCCIFEPQFSHIINMSRFYQISLFFLAPIFIVGCDAVTSIGVDWCRKMAKSTIWLTVGILLAYFAFTSGVVYEVMGSNITDRLVVPYSASLSGERTGLIGVFSKDDIECAEWLVDKSDESIPIVGDGNTWIFLRGYINQPTRVKALPFNGSCYYLFLRTWNIENQKAVMFIQTAGLRKVDNLPKLNAKSYTVVFQSGKAIIYEYRIKEN